MCVYMPISIHIFVSCIYYWHQFFQTLDILQQFCSNCGYGFLRLDGQTSTNIRQEIVTKFNSKHSVESKDEH